jgi:hypothetical protein
MHRALILSAIIVLLVSVAMAVCFRADRGAPGKPDPPTWTNERI